MKQVRTIVALGAVVCAGAAVLSVLPRTAVAQGGAAATSAPAAPRGKAVYEAHCAECHGLEGKGDGPAAFLLIPRPRDFSSARYKIRSTETGSLPTDDDLLRSIRQGLPGSAMPGWASVLPDEDIRAVAGYVKAFSPRFAAEPPEPIEVAAAVPPSPESVARGAAVYETLQCGKCHGTDGRGTDATATAFEDDWGAPLRAADLTEPWTFHGGGAPADVFMRFQAGMAGTPMPSFKGTASDRDMWDLANYVVSLRRTPLWEMSAAEVAAHYERLDAEARANPVRRGQYLVETMACGLCHSPVDAERRMLPGMYLAGGVRVDIAPFGTYPTGNLTSDKETGLGNWTDDEIKRAITKGILRDGTRLLPYPMDWPSFSTMSASDLDAMVAYLRTVPPVRNVVPRPTRTAAASFLWGKFKFLMLGDDPPMIFHSGNAGNASGGLR